MRRHYPSAAILTLGMLLVFSAPVLALEERGHDGFFLRFSVGPAWSQVKSDDGLGTFSDIGGHFHFDIGLALVQDLILYANLGGTSMTNPKYTSTGGEEYSTQNVEVSISDLGIGMSYYLMPANLFFGGSIGVAKDKFEFSLDGRSPNGDNSVELETDSGWNLQVNGGKEWWVSENWGLGISIFGLYGRVVDHDTYWDAKYVNKALGVNFSATYN